MVSDPPIELLNAAIAVVERWDSPSWKDLPATASYIHRLRNAIVAMGDAKAVNSSTEQAQSGIAPEAAALEPECAQPSPARSEIPDKNTIEFQRERGDYWEKTSKYYENMWAEAQGKLDANEPVSVSLRECFNLYHRVSMEDEVAEGTKPLKPLQELLKFLGVKYVD